MQLKFYIRKKIRALRQELSHNFINEASQKICEKLLSTTFYKASKHIGCYYPDENEVDPHFLIANTTNKSFYLPVIASQKNKLLAFYSYNLKDTLINNAAYSIPEPDITKQKLFPLEKLDMIILPLVAFDEQGNRIGRGAGFYDHTLSFLMEIPDTSKKPLLVGLAYEFQKVDRLFPDRWDIGLQAIITEQKIWTSF